MFFVRVLLLLLLLLSTLFVSGGLSDVVQQGRRIVETPFYNLNPSSTSTHFVRIPSKWQLHQRTDSSQNIRLTFALKQQNLDILEKLFWEVSDPRSPSYTHYLTRDQLRALVRPTQLTVHNPHHKYLKVNYLTPPLSPLPQF
jgi:hypothetical protein